MFEHGNFKHIQAVAIAVAMASSLLFLAPAGSAFASTANSLTAKVKPNVAVPAQVPAKPPTDKSYYMNSQSTATAYNLGCDQGDADAADGANSEAVLDFGGQYGDGSGTLAIGGFKYTNAEIESLAEDFAQGYYVCTGADTTTILILGIGTNNSYQDVSTAGGEKWGSVVNAVSSYLSSTGIDSQVAADGASDIEPGFGAASSAIAWSNGFSDSDAGLYINYGSADGCPQSSSGNGACNDGWDQYDVWYVSWGSAPALAAPEIYYQANAAQWQEIALYGSQAQSNAPQYEGPWDEYPLNTSTFTSHGAWTAFENELNSNPATAQTMPFSLEINDE